MKNKLLIVEDDDHKIKSLREFLTLEYPEIAFDITHSVSSAFRRLESVEYQFAIIDMSLPSFDNDYGSSSGAPLNFGGEEIVDYIDRLNLDIKVIIFTQYPKFKGTEGELTLEDIANRLKVDYASIYLGTVYYNIASDAWKKDLMHLVKVNN